MSEDWKQYEKEMDMFFSDLKRCPQGHEGQCCYLGTLEERLKKLNKGAITLIFTIRLLRLLNNPLS